MKHALIALLLAALPASAAVLHVEPGSGGDYPTIQAALDAASGGDIVQLAPGLYYGAGNTDLEFYSDVTVRGTGDPADTIIRCYGSASSHVSAFQLWEETGGTVENLTVERAWGVDGGAVATGWGSYTFRNCRFLDNHAARGGVWYGDQQGDVTFEDCMFVRNSADGFGGCLAATDETELVVRGCTFTNNVANSGAGVHLETDANVTIDATIMAWNRGGGAAAEYYSDWFTITCSDFYGNVGGDFPFGTAGGDGNFSADPRLIDPWGDTPDVDLAASSPCREDLACTTMGAGAELSSDGCTYVLDAAGTGMLASIQDAVDLVSDTHDEIILEDGVYTGSGNKEIETVFRSFTLRSRSNDPAACRLDAEGSGRHIWVLGDDSHVRLRGLGFHNGSAPNNSSGGSVLVRRSSSSSPGNTLTLSDCMFRENHADVLGGAIDIWHGTLNMDDTVFELNTATSSGGGIHTADVLIQANACRLEGNASTNDELAGWRMQNPLEGSFLMEVDAGNHPGHGIFVTGLQTVLELISCTFWDNEASGPGAGLCLYMEETGDPILTDCEFHGNITTSGAGGVDSNRQVTAVGCRFLYNRGTRGGGLQADQFALLERCTFTGNVAEDTEDAEGGGAWLVNGRVLDCEFEDNTADVGGGLYIRNLVTPLVDSTFRDNTAFKEGGGLHAQGDLERCSFIGNLSVRGGGAFMNGGVVRDCFFWDNTAMEFAAALVVLPEMHLEGCTIVENTTTHAFTRGQIGVGAYVSHPDYTMPSLERCIVANSENSFAVSFMWLAMTGPGYPPGIGDGTASCCLFWGNEAGIIAPSGLSLQPDCFVRELPGFCGPGDFTLHAASVALPANNDCGVQIGCFGHGCGVVSVDDAPAAVIALLGNHPNPFNPSTDVAFSLAREGHTVLEIVNLKGERLAVLVDGRLGAGEHAVTWDGRDAVGRAQPSGVYLARLISAGALEVQRMALVR